MARRRVIDPEFWIDEQISELPFAGRLLYIGLWNFADDRGVLPFKPKQIRAQVFPYDVDVDIEGLLDELISIGKLVLFEAEGSTYLYIKNFPKHQTIKRPTYRYPVPPGYSPCTDHGGNMEETCSPEEKRREVKRSGREDPPLPPQGGENPSATFDEFPHVPQSVKDAIGDSWGMLSPSSELLRKIGVEIKAGFPEEWMVKAIIEAGDHGAKSWAYLYRIIVNWRDNGGPQNGKSKEEVERGKARKVQAERDRKWKEERRREEEAARAQARLEKDPEYQRTVAERQRLITEMNDIVLGRMTEKLDPEEAKARIDALQTELDALPPLPPAEVMA